MDPKILESYRTLFAKFGDTYWSFGDDGDRFEEIAKATVEQLTDFLSALEPHYEYVTEWLGDERVGKKHLHSDVYQFLSILFIAYEESRACLDSIKNPLSQEEYEKRAEAISKVFGNYGVEDAGEGKREEK